MYVPFTVVPMQREDIPFVLEGYRNINRENQSDAKDPFSEEKIIRDILTEPASAFILIVKKGEISVGFTLYSKVYFAGEGNVMWVSQMYVHPSYRKTRAAYVLSKELVKIAQKNNWGGICAATGVVNEKTQKFLEHAGLRQLKEFSMFAAGLKNIPKLFSKI